MAALLPVSAAYAQPNVEEYEEEFVCDGASVWADQHKNFHIETTNEASPAFDKIEKWYGPDGKRFFKVVDPDTSKPGPWTSQILVPRPGKPFLLITIENLSDMASVYWVRPSQIVTEVFWGRMAETDFTVDVDKGEVLTARDINYGPAMQPLETTCPDRH